LAFESPLKEQRQVSWDLAVLMMDGSPDSMKLLEGIFPKDLLRVLYEEKPKVVAPKNSPQPQVGQPATNFSWEKFYECLQQNYETPTLMWNETMRRELIFYIGEELNAYDVEKVII
jgi:hypothetical protein